MSRVLDEPVVATAEAEPSHRPRAKARRAGPGRIGLHLALAAYCLTSAGGFVWFLMVSLKTNGEFFSTDAWALPAHPQWHNYVDAWTTAQIGQYFANSLYVTALSVSVSLLVATMASYVLARIDFRGRGLVRMFFLSGLMLPSFAIIIPLYSMLEDLHLLGSLTGLALVYIATTIPFSVYVLTSFLVSLPAELEEAAYIDGASPMRTFFSVVIPQVAPALASMVVLNVLSIWNEFFFALVFLQGSESKTVPVGIFNLSFNATYSANWVQLFAGLVITMIPMLVLFAFVQDRIARGITIGGLK